MGWKFMINGSSSSIYIRMQHKLQNLNYPWRTGRVAGDKTEGSNGVTVMAGGSQRYPNEY